MQLFFAKPSPFARRVRVLLRERGLLDRVAERATAPFDSAAELLAVNPASKVPVLVLADGSALSESFLIAAHLDTLGDAAPLLPEGHEVQALQLWGLAEGLTTAAWLMVIEGRRDQAQRSPAWVARQQAAVERSLAALALSPALHATPGYAQFVLGAALGFLDFRLPALAWRDAQPQLADWYAVFAQRPAMIDTVPG
jgi:glutathione S-transferase